MNERNRASAPVLPERAPRLELVGGRLTLYDVIGQGGMAAVHLGRFRSDEKTRTVAVKRPHAHLASKPAFVAMWVDEARLTLRLRHANVVRTLEVIMDASELLLVMEYVPGESLASVLAAPGVKGVGMPPSIAAAIVAGVADGLHAAHETRGGNGARLGIVHRDVSPSNILVGVDGRPRVLDFGIAKAAERVQTTREGQLKGTLRYTAPERLEGVAFDHRADVFALGLVLWECLVGQRAIACESDGAAIRELLAGDIAPPSSRVALPPGVDAIVASSLARSPDDRPPTAAAFAASIRRALTPASEAEVAAWLAKVAAGGLAAREALVREMERRDRVGRSSGLWPASPWRLALAGSGWLRRALGDRLARVAIVAVVVGATVLAIKVALLLLGSAPATGAAVVAERTAPSSEPIELHEETPSDEGTSSIAASAEPAAAAERATAGSARPRARSRPRRPRASCSPPYSIDERGIKRFKPECLHP